MISIFVDNRTTNMVPALPIFAQETDDPDISGNIDADCSECSTSISSNSEVDCSECSTSEAESGLS